MQLNVVSQFEAEAAPANGAAKAHLKDKKHKKDKKRKHEHKEHKEAKEAKAKDHENKKHKKEKKDRGSKQAEDEGPIKQPAADSEPEPGEIPVPTAEAPEPFVDLTGQPEAAERGTAGQPSGRGEVIGKGSEEERRRSPALARVSLSERHRRPTQRPRASSRDTRRPPSRLPSRDRSSHRRREEDERRPDSRSRAASRGRTYDDRRRRSSERGRDRRDTGWNARSGRDRSQDRTGERRRSREGDQGRSGDRKRQRVSSQERKEDEEFAAKIVAKIEQDEEDEDKIIEERRRKREEIMARHRQQQQLTEAAAQPTAVELGALRPSLPSTVTQASDPAMSAAAPASELGPSASATPARHPSSIDLQANGDLKVNGGDDSDTDMVEELEQGSNIWQTKAAEAAAEQATESAPNLTPIAFSEEQHKLDHQEKRAEDFDMFALDADVDLLNDNPPPAGEKGPGAAPRGLLDNYDDAEGYYNFQVGEVMNERYEVFATHGKGVFSTVLRARDKGAVLPGGLHPEVAIKVIRANDIMTKAGQTETVILRKLAGADPENRRHCIRLLHTFEYRHHYCLVFEPLDINLRQLTKKYGQGIGLNIHAVRTYTAQMLSALYHLRNCGVLHADIKPDNILVSSSRTLIKICDFGSAMFVGDNDITPYLVSRFYRSPEVILGLRYDHPMDIWSVGCVVYELFTGKILFNGKTNNEMLKLMMDVKGAFPKKMLRKGAFTERHFEDDSNMSFALLDTDPLTKRPVRRLIPHPTVQKDFAALLAGAEGERRKVVQLADLLERMIALDPEKRISAKEALRHPFIKDTLAPK